MGSRGRTYKEGLWLGVVTLWLGVAALGTAGWGALLVQRPADIEIALHDHGDALPDSREMSVEGMPDGMVTIRTVAVFRRQDGGLIREDVEGTGIVLLGTYIVTPARFPSTRQVERPTPLGSLAEPAEKLSERSVLLLHGREVPLDRALVDESEDVLVFRVPAGLRLSSFPYPIGNSDDLRPGASVYVMGNSLNSGITMREGIVGLMPPQDLGTSVRPEGIFVISPVLSPGEDGRPVVALHGRQLALVGLTRATTINAQRMGWAVKLNTILGLIRDMEAREQARDVLVSQSRVP
ncbi:MAG: serine protease [Deltaproteobacteria bacterium]|nr:serine protease [Deltaproteobacteria bacterium]